MSRHSSHLLVALCLALLLITGCASVTPKPVLNIYDAQYSVEAYHESGAYNRDVKRVAQQAMAYLEQRTAKIGTGIKLAIVFDIDETLLSNYGYLSETIHFGYLPASWEAWVESSNAPAITPVRDLFQAAVSKQVTPFVITGRPESQRQATVRNLEKVACGQFKQLYMKTESSPATAIAYKTEIRKQLTAAGYQIIINIGDQLSDINGGYAEKTYKLPNHIYFIP